MARPNARVLPEPVRPRPRTSRPASEFGSVAAWIGNGVVTPSAPRAVNSRSGMSSSVNASTGGSPGVRVTGTANSPPDAAGRLVRPLRPAGLAEREGAAPPRRERTELLRFIRNLPRCGAYRGIPPDMRIHKNEPKKYIQMRGGAQMRGRTP